MALNHARAQVGMFDSEGDGHPDYRAHLAHTRCEPIDEPEQEPAPDPSPEDAPAL